MQGLSTLTPGYEFKIPEHQRGFSWTYSNFDDLVKDMKLAALLTRNHYVGPLVYEHNAAVPNRRTTSLPPENIMQHSLEDGQQRITTMMLACKLVEEKFINSQNMHYRDLARDCAHCYKFDVNNITELRLKNSQGTFNQKLEQLLLGGPVPAVDTRPTERLQEMYDYIEEYLNGLQDQAAYDFGIYLIHKFKFVPVDLTIADVDKNLTFDTINTRGRPLSQFDKIKNLCVLFCSLRPGLNALQPQEKWYNSITKLEKFNVSAKEDEFINDFFMVYHDSIRVRVHDTYKFMVDEYQDLLDGNDPALEAKLTGFIRGWEGYANSFGFISTENRAPFIAPANAAAPMCSGNAHNHLTQIERLNLKAIIRRVHSSAHLRYNSNDFEAATKFSEMYLFRMYATAGHRTNTHESLLRTIASKIFHRGTVDRDISWYLGTLCWLLNRPGERNCTLQKFGSKLANGESKYKFEGGWNHGHYFLYEYERSFAGATHAWTSDRATQEQQQEHILPQSRPVHWAAAWPNEDRWKEAIHRLGNLVLTENQASNNALGNKWISNKINDNAAAYDYNNGLFGEREITNFADDGAGGETWLKRNILLREISLIEFALNRWKLPCCDDSGDITLPEEFGTDEEPFTINVHQQQGCTNQIDAHDEEE